MLALALVALVAWVPVASGEGDVPSSSSGGGLPERPGRPGGSERKGRPDRSERPGRAGREGRGGRGDRVGKRAGRDRGGGGGLYDRRYRKVRADCETLSSSALQEFATETTGQCDAGPMEKENCILRCVSAPCYDQLYGEDALEEGELNGDRSRFFRACWRNEVRQSPSSPRADEL